MENHNHNHDHDHDHYHDHDHDHKKDHAGHSHGGGHHHTELTNPGRAFAIAIILNSIFVTVEFGYGFMANSTALIADAGHNLSDWRILGA